MRTREKQKITKYYKNWCEKISENIRALLGTSDTYKSKSLRIFHNTISGVRVSFLDIPFSINYNYSSDSEFEIIITSDFLKEIVRFRYSREPKVFWFGGVISGENFLSNHPFPMFEKMLAILEANRQEKIVVNMAFEDKAILALKGCDSKNMTLLQKWRRFWDNCFAKFWKQY